MIGEGEFMAYKGEEKENKDTGTGEAKKIGGRPVQTIKWDDSKMTSSYANVCNVSSTREEVTLLFGTNQTWHTGQPE
ncbi:MAG: DUF3467 domain-containing protein, partial [Methanoregulaceae archaeon]|nr:DUF3467 domain-containing protein [Methanoregulaceae archaeon]